ncbi:T9SS type B sorting domain-containing protein [Mucilaginibacter pedocola]|uniref:IPT/TIG domain-containing protein n=1 Tax=Mucilaginibacter pedocola TaxID=1792845 RepID=A0A1S9PL29_9SPHI|nr:gliding motility-associated C-terminal domain-containing protein [Mucilaginibacter pedocola]OOQ61676.1 hypothetical protein BC343_00970 [Mucilaginibacter pedocola]
MMKNATSSAILLPKLYRAVRGFALALVLSGSVSAFAAEPISRISGSREAAFASTITSFAPASGAVGTFVTVTGTGFTSASKLAIGGKPAIITSYTATQIVGMVMPGAVTGKVTVNTGSNVNAAKNFKVVETPLPLSFSPGKLVDNTLQPGGKNLKNQGYSVAISADGSTAAVTAYSLDVAESGVKFYKKVDSGWVAVSAFLRPNGLAATEGFGYSVALSGDGSIAVVGSFGRSTQFNGISGGVYVFVKKQGLWSGGSVTKLDAPGSSVGITADGNTIITGRIGYVFYPGNRRLPSVTNPDDGVNLYHRSGLDNWSQIAIPTRGGKAAPGDGVGISPDGTVIVMNSRYQPFITPYTTNPDYEFFDVYTDAFVRSTATSNDWHQSVLDDYAYYTGNKFSFSADGSYLAYSNGQGAVYIRTKTGNSYPPGDESRIIIQGSSAALSADANTLVVGADGLRVYERVNGSFVLKGAAGKGFYTTGVAMSANASDVFYGNANDAPLGAVYTASFTPPPPPAISAMSPTTGPVGTLVKVTGVSLEGATLSIGGKDAIIVSNTGTVITGMVMPGAVTGAVSITKDTTVTGGNFTVTATPFPNVQNTPKMADTIKYASGGKSTNSLLQGTALAISADGNTAIAASGKSTYAIPYYSGQNVVFYAKVNGSWKQSRFVSTSYTNLSYPLKATLNADGTTALVVFADEPNSITPGFVYGYHKNENGEWVADAQGIPGVLGLAVDVSLSADGNTAVTGYKKCTAHGCETHANVFYRVNGVWAGQQEPTPPGSQPDAKYYIANAGSAVAISADGKTIATSTYQSGNTPGTNIYTNKGAGWVLQRALPTAVAFPGLSADGNVLLSGNRIYNRVGSVWTYAQSLNVTGTGAISADGGTVIFGSATGPAVYTRNGSSWGRQSTSFATGTPALAVALSADGASGFAANPQDTKVFPSQKYYGQDNTLEGTFPIGAVYGLGSGTPVVSPTVLATAIEFIPQTPDSIYFRFVNGSGSARAVFIKEGSSGFPTIVNGRTYTANPKFGQGTPAGAGWYCIYNGPHTRTDAAPLMAGLKPSTPYIIAIVEYNGKYGAEKYASTGTTGKTTTFDLNIRSSNLVFSNTTGTSTTLSWTSGSGVGRMVFVSATPYDSGAGPSDVYYSPNTKYGSGNQVNGYYCVYNGTGNSVNVTGLTSGQRYRAIVYDYNGSIQAPKMIRVYEVSESAANMVTPIAAPTGYATSLAFSNTAATSTTLSWVSSNGAARAVFLKLGTSGALNVVQGQTYNGNSSFGAGSPVGTNGWYCVYNGTGSSVNISGLAASSTYRAIVIEYNGSAGTEAYNLSRYNAANVTTTASPTLLLTTNQKRMLVEQDVLEDNNIEVNVHQALSPNGDGINDVFTIDGIGAYPENTVKVLNSNGEAIYSVKGYNNYSKAFDGHASNGTLQKAGTYFYMLEYKKGAELIRKTGYLVLKF